MFHIFHLITSFASHCIASHCSQLHLIAPYGIELYLVILLPHPPIVDLVIAR